MDKQNRERLAKLFSLLSVTLTMLLAASTFAQESDESVDGDDVAEQSGKEDAIAGAGEATEAAPTSTESTPGVESSTGTETPAVPGGYWGAFASTYDRPGAGRGTEGGTGSQIFVFRTFDPGILIGLGVNFAYYGDGTPQSQAARGATLAAGGPDPGVDKVAAGIALHGEYWVYNKNRMMIGPELTYQNQMAPSNVSFKNHVFSPGLAFWVVPFDVPLALGAAWDIDITKYDGEKIAMRSSTPALRIAFGVFK